MIRKKIESPIPFPGVIYIYICYIYILMVSCTRQFFDQYDVGMLALGRVLDTV